MSDITITAAPVDKQPDIVWIDGQMVTCLPRWYTTGGAFASHDFHPDCTFCGLPYRTDDQTERYRRPPLEYPDDESIRLHGDRSDEPLSSLYPRNFFGEGRP